jgi:uncharacterized membrane protein YbjE (DUF340 family)
MLTNLMFIFAPLIVGYMLPRIPDNFSIFINRGVMTFIYSMLFLMGLGLSKLDDFSHHFIQVLTIASTFFCCISVTNLAFLSLLEKNTTLKTQSNNKRLPKLKMALDSIQLLLIVAAGTMVGFIFSFDLTWTDRAMEWLLFALLFLIGIQLRASGLSLREILINIHGVKIAVVVTLSSWLGGAIAGGWLGLPIQHSLTLSSGFGWYSLSGIIIGNEFGPVMGSASFILELSRELFALVIIPFFICKRPLTSIGYAGATAMDFTLPIIQISGGIYCVPVALVSGFLLSLGVPIFMLLFISTFA